MMDVKKLDSTDPLAELKHLYMRQTTAPLDGMWLCGFVPAATHYGLYSEGDLNGFFCVNDEGYVLQFFVGPHYQRQSSVLFDSIVRRGDSPAGALKGAFVSTAEPGSLSLCLDHLRLAGVNALMYELDAASGGVSKHHGESGLTLKLLTAAQLPEAVAFATAAIGAPQAWLTAYYGRLIERGELFGTWEGARLIATGESRGYDEFQVDCADLGVVVAESERGRGLATQILKDLASMNDSAGLKSICSTERENVAAQTAIVRAGFLARNRILQFEV